MTVHVDVIRVLQDAWEESDRLRTRNRELTQAVYDLEEEAILLREMAGVDIGD